MNQENTEFIADMVFFFRKARYENPCGLIKQKMNECKWNVAKDVG